MLETDGDCLQMAILKDKWLFLWFNTKKSYANDAKSLGHACCWRSSGLGINAVPSQH
jgi:hypothetical protein